MTNFIGKLGMDIKSQLQGNNANGKLRSLHVERSVQIAETGIQTASARNLAMNLSDCRSIHIASTQELLILQNHNYTSIPRAEQITQEYK